MVDTSTARADDRRIKSAAFWLGFALSGFFDGILLHQVLQWHHVLSAIRGDDIRFQILADGYFHLLMYLIAVFGLWLLCSARAALERAGASRALCAYMLIGFGVWHFLDAVASHWILAIHRIKPDSDHPLLWDLGWLLAFGALPLALGLALRTGGRRPPRIAPSGTLSLITLLLLGAGYWSSQPPPGQDFTTIVFSPAIRQSDALAAALDTGDALIWVDDPGVFVVTGVSTKEAASLYRRGALLVVGSGAPTGCFGWSRAV
jgi:uncharacterized membrane protein